MSEFKFHSASVGAAAVAQTKRSTPTILIAEDSIDGREMMGILLRMKGYEVVGAEDGVQAVEYALRFAPDLVLLDFQLPRLNGVDAARNIHRNARLRQVPIVILSGHDSTIYREAALDAGCSDYLMKPIDFKRLDAVLERTVPLGVNLNS